MADNIISQYYTKNDGTQISNDYQFSTLQDNEKIINKNSGEKFVKNPSYSNVFDKVDEKISKIDDANANGVCSCKNASGVEVDTFKCHVPVTNSAPTLNWGGTSTIGTVDGKPLTVKLPNIILNYNCSQGINPDETYIMTLDVAQNGCHPSRLTISSLLELINPPAPPAPPREEYFYYNKLLEVGDVISGAFLHVENNINSNTETGSWKLLWYEHIQVGPNTQGQHSDFNYHGKFQKVG